MSELKTKKFEYTPLQNKVLEPSDKNVLVPASAGSGKTSVVIEKVCRQICDGVDVSQILVVTFTDAAAVEMQTRLNKALSERAQKNPEIALQIDRLPTADISTLHAFCKKLIKQSFFALDIDPSFSVCDEVQSGLFKAKALDEVLLTQSQQDSADFEMLIEAFGASRKQDGLKKSILDMHEFLCGVVDREKYLNETAYLCYETNLSTNPAAQIILTEILLQLGHFKHKFEALLKKCRANGFEQTQKLVQTVLNAFPVFKNDFEEDLEKIVLFGEISLPRKPAIKDDNPEYDAKEEFGEIKDGLTKTLKKIVDDYGDIQSVKEKLKVSKNLLENFLGLVEAFEKEYDRIKRLNNCLDFADLEKYTRQILQDPVLAEGIRSKYKYVYVDEYQDINGVQEDILLKVSSGNNMVMVGDVKQSIYGFRNSDPKIFMDKNDKYQKNDGGTLRPLNENFRSNPAILNFVNCIFDKVMTPEVCGIDYKQNRLIPKGEHQKTIGSAVVIDIISNNPQPNEQLQPKVYDIAVDKGIEAITTAQAEAKVVAKHIKELIAGGEISYGDIAVLCRHRRYLKEFALALKEYKIPVVYSDQSELLSSHEALLLLSFLKLINNPMDDISLTTVLSCGVVGLTFDDLHNIRRAHNDKKATFFEACTEYAKGKDSVALKLRELSEVLERCREMLSFGGIYEVLVFLNTYYHIEDYYLLLPDGARRSQIIMDFITSFAGLELDIPEYLNYAESLTLPSGGEALTDCVKIDTMHSSKGLEFDVVFLVGLAGEFISKTNTVVCDTELGIGISWFGAEENLKDNTIARKGIDTKTKIREMQEEMRLLYVGATRAKNYLFMVATNVGNIKTMNTSYEIKAAKSHFDFVAAAFNENTVELIKKGGVISQGEGDSSFSIITSTAQKEDNLSSSKILFNESDVDNGLKLQIEQYLDAIYKYDSSTKIAQKNSVTGLINAMGEGFESINSTPRVLTLNEHKTIDIDHAKLGSAYHLIMQKLDFKTASLESIDKLITLLIERGQIEGEYAKMVNRESVLAGAQAIVRLGEFEAHKEQQFMAYLPYNQLVKGVDIDDKVLLQGIIDLWLSGDKNIIVDYKTTKTNSAQVLCDIYRTQMELYKKATEEATKQKIDKVYIYSFHLKKLIEVAV